MIVAYADLVTTTTPTPPLTTTTTQKKAGGVVFFVPERFKQPVDLGLLLLLVLLLGGICFPRLLLHNHRFPCFLALNIEPFRRNRRRPRQHLFRGFLLLLCRKLRPARFLHERGKGLGWGC